MPKKYILLLTILLLFSFSSALNFGISPPKINLNIEQGQEVCRWIQLIGEDSIFEGEIKWSEKKTEKVNDYSIDSENMGLEVKFPEKTPSGEYELCFLAKKPGNYYGALKYKIENSSYGIISWIDLAVGGEEISLRERINLISGNVIGEGNETNLVLGGIFVSLLVVLTFVLIIKKK